MHEFRMNLHAVTPLYVAGSDPKSPEFRAPSLKGLLRFWYRAADPEFNRSPEEVRGATSRESGAPGGGNGNHGLPSREATWFGAAGTGGGQCPFLLRVDPPNPGPVEPWDWDEALVARFDEGRGRETKNGIRYFAQMALRNRRAIPPGSKFVVRALWPRQSVPAARRAFLGAAWLATHFGGIGTRSRRGFGSLCLETWEPGRGDWSDVEDWGELPILSKVAGPGDWEKNARGGLAVLGRWFPARRPLGHHARAAHANTFGPEFRVMALGSSHPTARDGWAAALNAAGRRMQDFRHKRAPDYDGVKNHLLHQERLRQAPERATFGLPLTFRFSKVPGRADFAAEHRGDRADRHASPLFVRVARVVNGFLPVFIRLAGPVPAMGGDGTKATLEGRALEPPTAVALDLFMESLRNGGIR